MALALVWQRSGDYTRAVNQVDTLLRGTGVTGEALYNAACIYSVASKQVREDMVLSEAERKVLGEKYASRSVEILQQAHTSGFFRDPAMAIHAAFDTDLNPIRNRADFQALFKNNGNKKE